ncbi:MAG: ANTAR domain-containing protein [Neomegalonema sp.]|nr:ANTAR domain-containing protein [Neomegalonema sp.]
MFLSLPDPTVRRALLIDPEAGRRELFSSVLHDRGFAIVGGFGDAASAIDAALDVELAFFHAGEGAPSAIEALETLREGLAAPILTLVDNAQPDIAARLIAAGADQVAPVGVQADRIAIGAASAIAVRARIQRLTEDWRSAKNALASMKLVARAKGVLMARGGLSEDEAHKRLQALSMTRNLPLPETARAIIEAEELLASDA